MSVDEIGSKHDEIRGVEGSFQKAVSTVDRLRNLKEEYPNLRLGVHSVVSKFNVGGLSRVYKRITQRLKPDSYICSPAQNRSELLNQEDDISPRISSYENWVNKLSSLSKRDYSTRTRMSGLIQAVRREYYKLAIRELKEQRQILPCYAGFASCHLTPYGDVWPCCTLAYEANMGNLKEHDYKFGPIWNSKRAARVRQHIKGGYCHCPMANIHYTNMLCNTSMLLRLVGSFVLPS